MQMKKDSRFLNLYFNLLQKYGKQNWWPLIEKGKVVYKKRKQLNEKEKFEIMVGAILTQNTSWKNVEKALLNLYKENLLDINKILKADNKILEEKIKCSGYYRQKVKKLKALAEFLKKNNIGELEKMHKEELREKLLGIYGVGKETADSILLYAFNKPIFIVDAYTRKLFANLGIIKGNENYDEIRILVERNFPKSVEMLKEFHALIVANGKQKRN